MLNAVKAAKVGRMEQELAAMRSVYFLVFNLKRSDKPQSVARLPSTTTQNDDLRRRRNMSPSKSN